MSTPCRPRGLLVVKFGGTSLATPEHRARSADTVQQLAQTVHPVVVVSAPGRAPAPYATDTLLALAGEPGCGVDAAEVDALIACGELLSAPLLALRLQGMGLAARSLTGAGAGIETDGDWGQARITAVDPAPLHRLIAEGVIPVVAGFQGGHQGRLATLGRGGTDLTAVALGAALEAPVAILGDVDGIYTADPRLVAEARRLPTLSYEDTALLTYRGARVLHPRAAEMALNHQVDVLIARADVPGEGTRLTTAEQIVERNREISEPLVIGGVTSLPGRHRFSLTVPGDDPREIAHRIDTVLKALADRKISLDMIMLSEPHLLFTVEPQECEGSRQVLARLGQPAEQTGPLAKVSVVGGGMHGRPGVMARLTLALHAEGIPILQSTDSFNVISTLVPQQSEQAAVAALHRAFFRSTD